MAYLFREKLNLQELAGRQHIKSRIILYEPEYYLGALYSHYLLAHNFDIKHCPDLANIKEIITNFRPELLVFNAESMPALVSVRGLLQAFPELKVVTTANNITQDKIKELMALGALGHVNRRFSRPADLPALLKTLLIIQP